MTAPAGLFEEFLPPEGEKGLFDEFLPKEEPAKLPKLRGRGMEAATPDAVRRVSGGNDPDAWMTAMRRPSATEQVASGVLGMPFQIAKHPVETAKQIAKDVVMSPARLGMYAAKKINEPLGIAIPEPFNVSGIEATMDALNVAGMLAGGVKVGAKPKVKVAPEAPVRLPRAGIVRTPKEQAAYRLAQAESNRRGPAVPTEGDVPLKVSFPPAEKTYPFGAAAGERGGAKALEGGAADIARWQKHVPVEPAASPFAKGGFRRRPAGEKGLFDEFLPPEAQGAQEMVPTPTAGDVPLNVPFPPAQRVYPLGASTGQIRSGPQGALRHPMVEPAPTPYTRQGVTRRPASDAPLLNESVPADVPPMSRVLSETKPVVPPEMGRLPSDMPAVPRVRGQEPSGVVSTPEGVVSVGPRAIPQVTQGRQPTFGGLGTADDLIPPQEPVALKGSKASQWKDLSEIPDEALDKELRRINELHAREEASVAFTETPEWVRWRDLPSKEKLNKGRYTTDNFGNRIKRQGEDLSDADGTMDPDVLDAWRKTYGEYNKRTLVRNIEAKRAAAIKAEMERRAAALEPPPVDPAEQNAYLDSVVRDDPMPPPSVGEGSGLRAVQGTGELKTRGLALGVEDKAVAAKLTDTLGDLPEYRTLNMADQATKATKLLADDADLARRVALGEALPPGGLLPESVFVAVENKALAAGDVGTLRELAAGRLSEEATTMGQRIRALAERDPDSPVAAMQRIVDARIKGAKDAKGATASTVKELQQHIADAVKMDPSAWTRFIDSLRC